MGLSLNSTPGIRILMVCLGNICRSPTAHAVLQKLIENEGLSHCIKVDSAGTGDYHLGAPPDRRSILAASRRGYDLTPLRARQICQQDFAAFDYVLAMDRSNLKDLRAICPRAHLQKLRLLLVFANTSHEAVPDPYYSGDNGFELVLDLVEQACSGLVRYLQVEHAFNSRLP